MNRRSGSTLPIVLAVTAVLALVFLTTLEAVHALRDEARRAGDEVRLRADALTLEAQISFIAAASAVDRQSLLLTPAPTAEESDALEPDLPTGLRDDVRRIRIDGRPYRIAVGDRTYVARIQDGAGLINPNYLGDFERRALMALLGASENDQRIFADRIADYIDSDDLLRPGGAERSDYERAGLAPPPNQLLIAADQLFGVLGFADVVNDRAWREMQGFVAPDPTSATANVNTAPAEVLSVLYGLSGPQTEQAIQMRETVPFLGMDDFVATVGVGQNLDSIRDDTLPNLRYHVRIVDRRGGQTATFILTATPSSGDRPFWVEGRRIMTVAAADTASESELEIFPRP